MRRLRVLDSARRDLAQIYSYIEQQSASAVTAERAPFKGYVIFFRYLDETFEVVRIIEGHRDIDAVFADEDS